MSFLVRHPLPCMVFLVVMLLVTGRFFPQLESRYEVEDFFPQHTLVRQHFDDYRMHFGRDDRWAFVLIESQQVWSGEDFQRLQGLQKRLEKLAQVEEVRTPYSVQLPIKDRHQHISMQPAFSEVNVRSEKRLQTILRRFAEAPWVNTFLSQDQKVAVVSILLSAQHLSHQSRTQVVKELEVIQKDFQQLGYRVRLGGYPVHRVYLSQDIAQDAQKILPLSFLALLVFLWLVFRNPLAVMAPLLVSGCSLWLTLGCMALLGIPTNILSPALFVLVLLMGVSDSIHLLSHQREKYFEHKDVQLSTEQSIKALWFPCLLTSVTTATAFLGLTATGIPMISHLGLGVAIGMLVSFGVTFLFIPTVLYLQRSFVWLRWQRSSSITIAERLMKWTHLVQQHPKRICIISGVAVMVALGGASQVRINSPLLADLRADHPIQETNQFLEQRLGGVISVDLLVYPVPDDDLATYAADRIQKIDEVAQYVRQLPGVLYTSNAVDMLKQLRPLLQKVPEQEANTLMPAALLLASKEIEPWVDFDSNMMRIRIRMENLETDKALLLFDQIEKKAQKVFPDSYVLTGQGYISQSINHEIVWHFALSFMLGLGLVALVLLISFQRPRYLLAILPTNLLPLLCVLGIMGFLGVELRYTSALVLAVTFGVVVDDSIHMLSQLHANRAKSKPFKRTMKSAGIGILLTSFVLGMGFLSLLYSRFLPNQVLGGLLATAAGIAVLCDLFLLPVLLQQFKQHQLVSVRVRTDQVSEEMLPELFRVFQTCYSNTRFEQFVSDLYAKDWILLLREGEFGEIRGFSTIKVFDLPERRCRILYSGDTVVDPAYWGQKALQVGFSRFVLRLRFTTFGKDIYWMLTTKGFKTYLLLTNYFACSWPRYEHSTPPQISALFDDLGHRLYAEKYDPKTGVIHSKQDYVKDGVVSLGEREMANPHIQYFAQKNPAFGSGDELLCVAHIRWREPFLLLYRSLSKGLRRGR